tara:strand:+ start:2285 stop:2812 length:528 start_codon:yes stop_codon:yes gene_type:complete
MIFRQYLFAICFITFSNVLFSQDINDSDEEYYDDEFYSLYDYSLEGQKMFVEDLLDTAGYIIKSIETYQTLPNNSRIFRVDLENSDGGFIFIRWDKKKKENYVDNKLIDSEIYYNLNAAKEIKRKQTEKESFGIEDIAIQASDQEKITTEEITLLRQEYKEMIEEREEQEKKEEK